MAGNFAEFGPEESGSRLADLDYAKDVTGTMQNLARIAEIQHSEAQLPLFREQARKTGAEADVLQQKAAMQKRFAEKLSQRVSASDGAPQDMGDQLFDMANMAGESGDVDEMAKLSSAGALVKSRQAAASFRATQEDVAKARLGVMHSKQLASMAAGVVDDSTLQAFKIDARGVGYTGVDDIPDNYEQAKPLLTQIKNQGLDLSQYLQNQIAERRQKSFEQSTAALVQSRSAAAAASSARVKRLNQIIQYTAQNEGERSAAAADLKREQIRSTKLKGDVENLKTLGKTPLNPKIIPTKDGKPTAEGLLPGEFYTNPQGKVYQWDGSNMMPVQMRKAVNSGQIPGLQVPLDEDDDDDE